MDITRPGSEEICVFWSGTAGNGSEEGFPAFGRVPPSGGVEDKSSSGRVGHDEAIDEMVDLTRVTTSLVKVAHEKWRMVTAQRILSQYS